MQRRQSHALFSGSWCQDKNSWAQTTTQVVLSEWVAKTWYSLPRQAVQSPPWRSSQATWTTCSGWPCLNRQMGSGSLLRSFPTSASDPLIPVSPVLAISPCHVTRWISKGKTSSVNRPVLPHLLGQITLSLPEGSFTQIQAWLPHQLSVQLQHAGMEGGEVEWRVEKTTGEGCFLSCVRSYRKYLLRFPRLQM